MSEPFLAEIRVFGFNFAPRGWMTCDGQILAISQNTALFSLLGTTYGGNGQTTFALPNFGSLAPVGQGNGNGLTPYVLGEQTGSPSVTLLSTEMPTHNHPLTIASSNPNNAAQQVGTPGATAYISGSGPGLAFTTTPLDQVPMSPQAIGISPSNGSQPHENRQPFLALMYCIAVEGVFPTRN